MVLIPRANRVDLSRPPAAYRDYPRTQDRILLLRRILERLRKRIPVDSNNASAKSEVYYKFIESWFIAKGNDRHYEQFSEQFDTVDLGFCPPPLLRMAWSSVDRGEGMYGSSSESSLNEVAGSNIQNINQKGYELGRLQKDNMDEFLSWAFFGVHNSIVQSTPETLKVLDEFYQTLKAEANLTFESGRNPNFSPRCFTFEEVKSLYRPYCVYAGVALLRIAANMILLLIGFRQYTCERGLRYWHRAPKSSKRRESSFIFFHGIAPGGFAPYLPMIFFGLLRESSLQRDIFFFENLAVSYSLCFDSVSEEDTVHGVLEAIDRHLICDKSERNLTLCGHSLGSCQLTWMVKSSHLKKRIQNLILIDPVSILLSEPDVMINFLYTRRESEELEDSSNSWALKFIRFFHESKIHLVASSEIFIEHYLRRNFAWYNSELWLADVPKECNVLVCLSEHDEIVNSSKVEKEVSDHNNIVSSQTTSQDGPIVDKIMWKDVGHAHCITHYDKWLEIFEAMCRMK
eukprot:scaffold26736_cov59-Cyclotella_meneghiniana.AAC.1